MRLLLRKHPATDRNGGNNACGVGNKAGGQSVAAPPDSDGAEINSEDVEGRFGAAEDGGGGSSQERIRTELGHEFVKEAAGCAAAEGADEDHREQVGWDTEGIEDRRKQAGHDLNPPGFTEHFHSNQNGDKRRDDAERHFPAFLGTGDKFFVDLDAPEGGVQGEESQHKRDGQQRENA